MRTLTALFAIGLLATGAAEAGEYKAPRNAAGQPDFQGIWTNTAVTMLVRPPIIKGLVPTPEEAANFKKMFMGFLGDLASDKPIDPNKPAPPEVKSVENSDFIEMKLDLATVKGELRSSWIVEPDNGQLPVNDAGKALTKERRNYANPESRPPEERCLTAIGRPEGPPMLNTGFNGHYQFIQTRDHVAIHIEMNHDVRIIRLNERTHQPSALKGWMGDSSGWWEGDTLVVETTNMRPEAAILSSLMADAAYTEKAKIVERFTRISDDEILYEFTVEDPAVFSRPWRAEMSFRPAAGPIYEYACHEGNYSLENILAGARVQEREQAEAEKAKTLAAAAAPTKK
jgi:hypothetical protein